MSSINPSDYIPVVNTIIGNWQQVNIALGNTLPTDLKLKGNYLIANLIADRDALQLKVTDVQSKTNLREDAAALRDTRKTNMRN